MHICNICPLTLYMKKKIIKKKMENLDIICFIGIVVYLARDEVKNKQRCITKYSVSSMWVSRDNKRMGVVGGDHY